MSEEHTLKKKKRQSMAGWPAAAILAAAIIGFIVGFSLVYYSDPIRTFLG